jgi:predicted metallo-beta-lactamase superfamily hydrolase
MITHPVMVRDKVVRSLVRLVEAVDVRIGVGRGLAVFPFREGEIDSLAEIL